MNGIQVFLAAYAQPLIWLAVALVMLIIEAATVQMEGVKVKVKAIAGVKLMVSPIREKED